ncbi:MAG: hypothetical protein L7V85_02545 [Bacteroidia bacterium]|nr:hypothetical protein [Bacteroidia bacterium]
MDSFDQTDVELLFKSIVVLPQDSSKKTALTDHEIKQKKPKEYEAKTTITKADEPQTTTKKPSKITVILTTPKLKEDYMVDGSSFLKILDALKINSAKKLLDTEITIDDLINYTCVWCVGLPPEVESKILKIDHPNILLSPDILNLKTKEEKMAMYNPLKEFIAKNKEQFTAE